MHYVSNKKKTAEHIISKLIDHGYKTYFVGGFVRDTFLGWPVQDIDIATSAKPSEVIQLFPHTVPTGLQHGTVTVIENSCAFEVTTFRKESHYQDHRHSSQTSFIDDLHEDLHRRDFKMNAMAMDLEGNLIDPYGGIDDLRAKRLSCVGEPQLRFEEDALRMMRCIRFAAHYDLEIETNTWKALLIQREKLKHVAMERVREELDKIMDSYSPQKGLQWLFSSELLQNTKIDLNISKSLLNQIVKSNIGSFMTSLKKNEQKWAAFLLISELSSKQINTFLKKLTLSRKKTQMISQIIAFHEWFIQTDQSKQDWKTGLLYYGQVATEDWLDLFTVLLDQSNKLKLTTVHESVKLKLILKKGRAWSDEIQVKNIKDLNIKGNDLLQLKDKHGAWISQILHNILLEVMLGKLENNQKQLLLRAKQMLKELDQMKVSTILSHLNTKVMGKRIFYAEKLESTQIKAQELSAEGAEEGTLVITEQQTNGRGTKGRRWFSPPGKGLWFSLILRPKIPLQFTHQLTLVVSVALCRSIRNLYSVDIGIKWPNDLLINNKKVSGILLESIGEENHLRHVVVGIGISVNLVLQDYPLELRETAISLRMASGSEINREELLCEFLKEFEQLYHLYLEEGLAPICTLWEALTVSLNCPIQVSTSHGWMEGTAKGLDERGALLLTLKDGREEKIYSGDVIHL